MISIRQTRDEVTPHLRKLLKEANTNSPLSRVLGRQPRIFHFDFYMDHAILPL